MVKAKLQYLEWQEIFLTEKPFQVLVDVPKTAPDQRRTNLTFTSGIEEEIRDARGEADTFKLDMHGFAYVAVPTRLHFADFSDRKKVESEYLEECKTLLKTCMDGVDQIHIYNWLVRDSDSSTKDGRTIDLDDPLAKLGPAQVVHIDQNGGAAVERVFRELPLEAHRLLLGRLRLIKYFSHLQPQQQWTSSLQRKAFGALSTGLSRHGHWPFVMAEASHLPRLWNPNESEEHTQVVQPSYYMNKADSGTT